MDDPAEPSGPRLGTCGSMTQVGRVGGLVTKGGAVAAISTPVRIAAVLRRHIRLTASVTTAIVVAAVAIPLSVATADHANADAAYQQARRSLGQVSGQLTSARAVYAKEHAAVAALSGQLAQVQSAAGTSFTAAQLQAVTASSSGLQHALALAPGAAATRQEATGTSRSTTADLRAAAATLNRQSAQEAGRLKATRRSTTALSSAEGSALADLDAVAIGSPKSGEIPAVDGLDVSLAGVLSACPQADQATKDALTASAVAAKAAAAQRKPVASLLLAFLSAAQTVRGSQAAAVAAAAQAAAAAEKAAAAKAAAAAARAATKAPSTNSNPAPPRPNLISPAPGPIFNLPPLIPPAP